MERTGEAVGISRKPRLLAALIDLFALDPPDPSLLAGRELLRLIKAGIVTDWPQFESHLDALEQRGINRRKCVGEYVHLVIRAKLDGPA